ncbi:FAD-dependent oxidoreductase [Chakrabartia godavariana]|nr:FAD-dependent oxidoreductase [Chakrabartia godavariana]
MELNFTGTDICAVNGTRSAPETRYDVVVVGAGPSGIAAAIDAAASGKSVLLVDENPVSGALMGNDTPLYFGGRMTAATQNADRMLEAIFMSMPDLEKAMEAGAELLLGTTAWGVYRNGPGVASLPDQVVGLADSERSWMVGFSKIILATGARDLALAFPGWNQPGVMGAAALQMLLTRYDAFAGRRVLVLGSHDLALETALLAHGRGVEVLGLVETRDAPQGRDDLVAAVKAAGIPITCGQTIASAKGGIDGVEAATLTNGETIACDTICVAIGLVPSIELVDAMHGPRSLNPTRGGYVPAGEPSVDVVGDCAGLPDTGFDHVAYRMDWMRALTAVSTNDTIICQCEEVTRADLIGVQPPNYLPRPAAMCARSLETLLKDGPANQDQIKRLTRAGMGVCQGRRCRDQVAMLLALESGTPFGTIPLASHRAPVRPLPLKILAEWDEPAEMEAAWDVWFGIPTQWVPVEDVGTPYEDDHREMLYTGMYK